MNLSEKELFLLMTAIVHTAHPNDDAKVIVDLVLQLTKATEGVLYGDSKT